MKKLFLLFLMMLFLMPLVNALSTDAILVKVAIKEGESITKTIKIENTEDAGNFNVQIAGLGNLASVDEDNFFLASGDTKNLILTFSDAGMSFNPDVYVGKLAIKGTTEITIPLIIEIESQDVLFDANLNVPLAYENVYPGGKFVVDVNVFNLEKMGLEKVEMRYYVKDFEGNTVLSEAEDIAVETSALVTKTIALPKSISKGNYVFIAISKYNGFVGTSSYFFKVGDGKSIFEGLDLNYAYIIALIVAVLLLIALAIAYSIKRRDELFLKLERQHQNAMKMQLEILEGAKKIELKYLRGAEKHAKKKEFAREKKERKVVLVRQFKERKKELKQLKKKGLRSKMAEKLKQWAKQGYNVGQLNMKIAKPTKDYIKNKVNEWKKKGFDVRLLENKLEKH